MHPRCRNWGGPPAGVARTRPVISPSRGLGAPKLWCGPRCGKAASQQLASSASKRKVPPEDARVSNLRPCRSAVILGELFGIVSDIVAKRLCRGREPQLPQETTA
jgi:hypothetical protein